MTDIVQMSKDGAKFYPQTHAQAVLGLPDFSTFEKASDVQTAISSAIKGIAPTNLTNYPTKSDVTTQITTAVAKAKPDLTNYPTRSEMTTAITKATPNVSGFVTMTQVQSTIDNVKIDLKKVGEVND